MEFYSILYENYGDELSEQNLPSSNIFNDLNLDQIINEILLEKEEYHLRSIFYHNLKTTAAIDYRLAVMKDLENDDLIKSIISFSYEMKKVREYLEYSNKLHNKYQTQKWLLDSANMYCNAIISLYKAVSSAVINSRGLMLFKNWLDLYINNDYFRILSKETYSLQKEFDDIRYSINIENSIITVTSENDESDYCAQINSDFEQVNKVKFGYSINFFTDLEMNVLENKIYDIVRSLNIDVFNKLESFSTKHMYFSDEKIKTFDREIQFYVSYLQYIQNLKSKGFNFTYPEVSSVKKINIAGGYDLALAYKSLQSQKIIISNDFYLENEERISILTGPNQGGKTTYARAFGQIMFLASIGCPVPCKKAELFIFDNIFTHFAAEENLNTNAGRLQEELIRIKQILENATANSIIIINELFATTTSYDAFAMGERILNWVISHDCICLYVTHIYELTRISSKTVSLIATVDSDEKASRTYKIRRKLADGIAYTNSIVEKYDLTYYKIKERIKI